MTDRAAQRLDDILSAIAAIHSHLGRGSLDDGLVFDAVRIRLLEIGEAVKALPDDLLTLEPAIPWRQVAGMRDYLAHRYFDTNHAVVAGTVTHDVPVLEEAIRRRRCRLHDPANGSRPHEPRSE